MIQSTAATDTKPLARAVRRGARFFVAALAACCMMASTAFADAPQSAERPKHRPVRVEALTSDAALAHIVGKSPISGNTSAVLVDMRTGKTLSELRPGLPMPPASVTKVVTTLYGLEHLGRAHSFSTRLLAVGEIRDGVLNGDLILAGGGDPELDTDELAGLVDALGQNGISAVTGAFLYDDSRLPHLQRIGRGQPPNAAYNPGLSGLNLNFNRVFFEWEPSSDGIDLRLEARDRGYSPPVSSMQIEAVDRAGPVYLYSQQGGADHWSIARGALRKAGGVWLPVRDPGRYAADAFAQVARAKGITLANPRRAEALPPRSLLLGSVDRRPLFEVSRGMLHFSTNVTAELIGLSASETDHDFYSLGASAERMSRWLAGRYGTTTQSFADHSGLSDESRISAGDMARIVASAGSAGQLDGLLRQHFVARPGTNQPAVKGAEVRAKTGTLNFVRGLSGIITGANGQKLAFAIFSSDLEARAAADHTRTNPPGARTFNRRAVYLEQAILANWLERHAR